MSNTAYFNGKTISYKLSGTGPALVLLHGFIESKEIWNDFESGMESDFTLISIDLPGHGQTDTFFDEHSMEFMADAVKEVLDIEGIKQCAITGHSMGGYVALAFAEKYTSMVKGICLFHSHGMSDSDDVKKNRDRTLDIIQKDKGGFITMFIPNLSAAVNIETYASEIEQLKNVANNMNKEAVIAAILGMKNRISMLHVLVHIDVPVLFILGKEDSRIPYDKILAQAALPKHAEIFLLNKVGHMGYIEAKGKTLSALKAFTKRCY
ncbi:MAG: alpha/beta hydrolase [Bacteroidales bacterium]|nr:alpha/beta hydrolase [Bacteroidales bacterium]